MAVNLSPVGGVAGQFFDNNGNPLTGGKLYTYAAGTTTPQATYTSAAGVIAHSNPIILNAGGRVPNEIWLTDGLEYKFALYDANNVLIGTWDDIIGINSNFVNFVTAEEVQIATAGQTVFTLTTMQYQPGTNNLVVYVDGVNQVEGGSYSYVETNSTTVTFTAGLHVGAVVKFVSAESLSTNVVNASTVIYDPAGSGAVATTVQAKLRETVSVKDFGAVGDGVTDDTAAFQSVLTAAGTQHVDVYIPSGKYRLTSTLTIPTGVALTGEFWPRVDTTIGSWLYFDHANVGLRAITDTVTIAKLGTVRNQPAASTVGFTPTANDWDITLFGDDYLISEVMLLNPTKGIQLQQGGRVTIEKINGEPLTLGIEIVTSTDTSYINQVHFWPFWSAAAPEVETWKKANATAFYSRRNDNPQWTKLFSNGYKYGIRIGFNDASVSGFGIDGTTNGANFSQVNIDNGVTFLEVDSDSDGTAVNIVQFSCGGYWPTQSNYPFSGINIQGTNGRFFLTNAAMVEVGKATVNVGGTGNIIVFDGLQTGGYGYADLPGAPTTKNIEVAAGNEAFVEAYWTQSTASTAYFAPTITPATVSVNAYNKQYSRFVNLGNALPLFSQQEVGQGLSGYVIEQPGARRYKFGIPVSDSTYKLIDNTGSDLSRYELSAVGDHTFFGDTSTTTVGRFVIQANNGTVRPFADNTQLLGDAPHRWSEIFAGNGTINTSDANEKQQIQSLSVKEKAVGAKLKSLIKTFKFNDAVEAKGIDARIHAGVIAQDVKLAFESEGLSAEHYGVFCSDTWVDDNGVERTRLGVRYDELFAFIIGAM